MFNKSVLQLTVFLTWISLCCILLTHQVLTSSDYYEMLGIKRDANNKEIRKAFKKLALTMHPDKNIDDPEAHNKFVNLNKAYEVLKDPDTRKKYDAYGEKGLKDDFGSGWRGSFHSWNYYQESFGIYDDDPEIVTLSKSDFERFVQDSNLIWFVNFYSPQCSHCHTLAPNWRRLARSLEGVVQIGAVNCGDEWSLCRGLNIRSYPSLVLYPNQMRYQGTREIDDMEEFVLKNIRIPLVMLTGKSLENQMLSAEFPDQPWLIYFCETKNGCWEDNEVDKVAFQLTNLYNVGQINCYEEESLCKKLGYSKNKWVIFTDLEGSGQSSRQIVVEQDERKEMVLFAINNLPATEKLTFEKFQDIRDSLKLEPSTRPWLIYFEGESNGREVDVDLKRLRSSLVATESGIVDCSKNSEICSKLYLTKLPAVALFRPGGSYEVFHGDFSLYNLLAFVKETLNSRVHTLEPHHFPGTVVHSGEPWFVDFFAPWCPPCMSLLPEWRKASIEANSLVHFGSVDCTIHKELCSSYNIKSYPTAILFNQTIPHQFYGGHHSQDLVEFVQDILNPTIMTLNPGLFSKLVDEKPEDDLWAIDFHVPWCGPCQKLGPHWRKVSKAFASEANIHIGQLDCQEHKNLCQQLGINSYPTLRIYPFGSKGIKNYRTFGGWNRDSKSLQAWVRRFLPSHAKSLSSEDFFSDVLLSQEPWVIDFYAPWCGHCQMFEPTFEEIARKLKGKVKAGKVNCDEQSQVCQHASINAYPSLRFYEGSRDGKTQIPWGEDINSQEEREIFNFLSSKINTNNVKDEL